MQEMLETFLQNNSGIGQDRKVSALFEIMTKIYGPDKLVLKAGKVGALNLLSSPKLEDRVLCLQRLVFEDPTAKGTPKIEEIPKILDDLEERIVEMIAQKEVTEKIENKIAEKMKKNQDKYIEELKKEVYKEEAGFDNARTLKKYAELEILESKEISRQAIDLLRPQTLNEVVGQDRAIKALLAKIASPYPQHVILYGPPGVGKTTIARLALEEAKQKNYTCFNKDAKFVEVDGTTLRWDPRESTNPLIGSVHDPIYQGARTELAESGVPEPKTGLVTDAHGGILFIDEIGELDSVLLNKLLKVLEDKRVNFDSSYYDPEGTNIPKYIKKLFENGAPADFILIGATTRFPGELSSAIRSRCAEVYFDPLSQDDIKKIISHSAKKLNAVVDEETSKVIAEYTTDGRQATNVLADAFGLALYRDGRNNDDITITLDNVYEAVQMRRLHPRVICKASDTPEVGRVLALGVEGFLGSVLEIEAIAYKTSRAGNGKIRFNETAGVMVKDSLFNANSVLRKLIGCSFLDYDLHVNIVGGGKIEGPSAGLAILVSMYSAIKGKGIHQNVALTGEISIQGKIKPVGGIPEKIYGACQAGMKKIIIPKDNKNEIPSKILGVEIIPVEYVEQVLPHVLDE